MRYRLLSEPELSNLLKTTLSNGSLHSSTDCHPTSNGDIAENASTSDLDLTKEPKSPRLLATDDNDNNSQNRNNNNLVQTWNDFNVRTGWAASTCDQQMFVYILITWPTTNPTVNMNEKCNDQPRWRRKTFQNYVRRENLSSPTHNFSFVLMISSISRHDKHLSWKILWQSEWSL